MKKNITIRLTPELSKKYKIFLAERQITMQEHLENFIRKEVKEMTLKEKIKKAWLQSDASKIADELLDKAKILTDTHGKPQGSIDAVLVYDTETDKLIVCQESKNTYTPSFIYLFRLSGNDRPDIIYEELYYDLINQVNTSINQISE